MRGWQLRDWWRARPSRWRKVAWRRFRILGERAFAVGKCENPPVHRTPQSPLVGSDEWAPEYGHLGLWVYEEPVREYSIWGLFSVVLAGVLTLAMAGFNSL